MPSVSSSSVCRGVGLLDGDDTFLADLVEGLGDELADLVVCGGDGGNVAIWLLGLDLRAFSSRRAATASTETSMPRLIWPSGGAGGDVAQAFLDQCLGEDGGGGGAVTGDVVRLGGDFLGQLGAEVLVRVVQLDLRAMVTPSLVIVGAPHFLSRTTLRPRGRGSP
jgi:hypothetical protein